MAVAQCGTVMIPICNSECEGSLMAHHVNSNVSGYCAPPCSGPPCDVVFRQADTHGEAHVRRENEDAFCDGSLASLSRRG